MNGKLLVWMLGFILLSGCTNATENNPSSSPTENTDGGATMKIDVTSTAFEEGKPIPKLYTGDGKDISPPLKWGEPPAGAKSVALIADDPDAPRGTWVHWVLFNLPPDTRSLDEGIPKTETLANGAKQGKNDFGKIGYGGPAPPKGMPHRYYFKLNALDDMLKLPAGATKADVEKAMKGHVLAEGQLMGTYQR
jgi:Raf kinase inhibitor-like YbhB/YbcL family protein